MEAVKRVEIITDSLQMKEVRRVLDGLSLSGYSVIRDVTGVGERGEQTGDELTDVFKNSLLMLACPPERVEEIVAAIRPILKRRGGVCLVSDAMWVIH
jgi:nitrogen regulatory protein PII